MARTFQASFPGDCTECGEICCADCLLQDEEEIAEGVEGWKGFANE